MLKHSRRTGRTAAADRRLSLACDERGLKQLLRTLPEPGTCLIVVGQLNRQEIGGWVGLAPFNHDSGRCQGKRSIWGGRAAVRSVRYMAALPASRCNPTIRAFAQRLRKAGKPFKVMITACMRKLLVILNTMVRKNSHWHAQPVL